MAKRLLLNVLVKVLGEFIELNEENLNLAVWSGQIVLTNLRLKTDHILKTYNLNVFHGSVQRLEVTIPWASLLINPVKIVIDGVLLDVGPLDIAKLGKVEALKRYMAEKLQKLKMVDQYLELSLNLKGDGETMNSSSSSSKDPNSESYIQQWTAKIIDNIEIKVTNLHVRYEDRLSIPGRVFACGLTLSSFGLSASDKNWNIGATKQADNNSNTANRTVYKLAYLACLGIYWQVDAASMAAMPLKEWERVMMLYIVKEDWTLPGDGSSSVSRSNSASISRSHSGDVRQMPSRDYSRELMLQQNNTQTREYILSPYKNSLTLKLTQNKTPNATRPKFDVCAESSNLQLHFDSVQYVELFSVVDRISALGRMFKPRSYRPNERPYNRRSAIAWWKYACKLAIRSRRYTDLVKLSLRLADGREDPHQYLPDVAAAEVRYLEERLPFEPLRVGRQRALLELYEEEKQVQRMQSPQGDKRPDLQRARSSWWGTWYDSPVKPGTQSAAGVKERVDGDISIDSILTALNESDGANKPPAKNNTAGAGEGIVVSMFRFSLQSSSRVLVSSHFRPILQCNSALSMSFTKTSAGMTFQCDLQDLLVLDRYSKDPPVPYIVSVKSELSYVQRTQQLPGHSPTTQPTFSLHFERISGKSKVVIAALPIELCLNKECIQMVLSSFARPENPYAEKVREHTRKKPSQKKPDSALATAELGIQNLRNVSQHNDDIEVVFEASAPKIIIPESSEDCGYVLLDCGYLEVKGLLSTAGMSMNVDLTKVSVGMPITVRDMYKFGEKALYLIKPFDILLQVQNIDQALASMTIGVEVRPEIRGEIDSIKLARLLTALGQVSGIFVRLPPPADIAGVKESVAAAAAQLPSPPPLPLHSRSTSSGVAGPTHSGSTKAGVATPLKSPAPGIAERAKGKASSHPLAVDSPKPSSAVKSDVASPESVEFHTPERTSLASQHMMTPPSSSEALLPTDALPHINPEESAAGKRPHRGASTGVRSLTKVASYFQGSPTEPRSPEQPAQPDATVNNLRIDVRLPLVALDLMYDVAKGYHLVLEVHAMRTTLVMRPFDRRITFELSAMSMHDNFRAAEQSHLMWTPADAGKLVHISYTNISNRRSPYYRGYATDMAVRFANLGLNVDANTINHLRPFFEVLLAGRRAPTPPASPVPGNMPPSIDVGLANKDSDSGSGSPSESNHASSEALSGLLAQDEIDLPPEGTVVCATLERISLDLLRVPTVEKKGALLESAFSAQISGMRCDADMRGLTKAEVRLRSFEILDIRSSSRDYVFRKVFCPAFADDSSNAAISSVSPPTSDGTSSPRLSPRGSGVEDPSIGYNYSGNQIDLDDLSRATRSPASRRRAEHTVPQPEEANLLFVVFKQQSKTHNHFDLVFSDITSFIAVDTILDLTSVALANVFAFFGLLAAPSPAPGTATTSSSPVKRDVQSAAAALVSNLADQMFASPEAGRKGRMRSLSRSRSNSSASEDSDLGGVDLEPETTSTMSVVLRVRNPRLIFLEDPSSEETQAIVGTCGVQVNYTRDTKTRSDGVTMLDSLHITLSKYEVYVLSNIARWYPQPILEPVEVELHLKRRIINGVTKVMNTHIELDNIVAQVSFNDILLAQSILSRRMLSEAPAAPPADSSATAGSSAPATSPTDSAKTVGGVGAKQIIPVDQNEDDLTPTRVPGISTNMTAPIAEEEEQPTRVSFQLGMSLLSAVVINDFNGQSVPIIKATVSNSHFGVESVGPKMDGQGGLDAKVDFFNPRLSVWEPILDTWHPTARIYSLEDAKIFEVKSDYTMQLTVSGVLLETLLRSYSLFFHDLEVLAERTGAAGISVTNLLGDGADVELLDSGTKDRLVELPAGQSRVLSARHEVSRKYWSKASNLPTTVDLHFTDLFRSQRMPLFHLPLSSNKPKAYNLQPVCGDVSVDGGATPMSEANSVWITKPSKVFVVEPIVEEVYENSRYDPLMGCWRKPYVMGDPYEWTDGSGTVRRDIGSIALTSDRWEWQGNWEIDMDGEVGKEIDTEGWEYASSFSFFTMVSPRRACKAMDTCRRRRWTRTRIPVAKSLTLQERPLTLFWDVHVNNDGSRSVDIRSALQVCNKLSYPIMLCLLHSVWDRDVELGPISPDATLSVPLLYSYASNLKVRPANGAYDWSLSYPCSTLSYDFTTTRNGGCRSQDTSHSGVWFRTVTKQTNKSLLVSVVPHFTITNKLLCDLRFVFIDRDGMAEEGEAESGRDKKLSFINVANYPMLAIKVGNFEWSERLLLTTTGDSASLFELKMPGRRSATKLYLSMNSKTCPLRGLHIEIFSKVAVIDRTSLHLFLASRLRPGVNIVRSTCSSMRPLSAPNAAVAPPPGTNRERLDSVESLATAPISAAATAVAEGGHLSTHSSHLSLKLPNGEHSGSAAPTPHNLSRSRLLSSESGSDLQQLGALAHPIVSSFKNTNNFPETPTVRVDVSAAAFPAKGPPAAEGATASATPILVRNIEVSSRKQYQLVHSAVGKRVYTDYATRWCYLPPFLTEQQQLRTPYEDRFQRSNKLVQFTTTARCMVVVLVDINSKIKWLGAEGFTKVREIATARCVTRGVLEESHFAIYGKLCGDQQRVTLRSCWNKSALTMYALFFIPLPEAGGTGPAPAAAPPGIAGAVDAETSDAQHRAALRAESLDSVFRQLQFKDAYTRDLATRSWTEGCNNLSLMYTFDNMLTVGLCKGKVWSKEINIDTRKNAATKGSFEVENLETGISYQLSYSLHALPGLYAETQLIYFMPRYCILNCTEETLLVSQRGSEKYLQYQPYRPDGWHKLELESRTEVQLRTSSTLWSLGAIDINDVGSSVLFIPYRDTTTTSTSGKLVAAADTADRPSSGGIVLHVEVKLADPADNCSIIVVVWQETVEGRASMCIRNTSDMPVTIRQADIESEHELKDQEHLFEIVVPPGRAIPFGWADLECGTEVLIAVGEGLRGPNRRIAAINLLKTEQLMRLPYNVSRTVRGEVVVSVTTNNSGHVLEISNMRKGAFLLPEGTDGDTATAAEAVADIEARQRNAEFPTYGFNFLLSSFGVSLVVEKPTRREFLSLYIDWLEVLVRLKGSMRSLEFLVMDLQVDNYSETTIYPVLLRSRKKEVRRSVTLGDEGEAALTARQRRESVLLPAPESEAGASQGDGAQYERKPDDPFIRLTIVQEVPPDRSRPVFKYVACRVLSLAVEVDSATVQLLFTDLLDDLKILNHSQALALSMPDAWLNEFNQRHLYPQQQLRMVHMYRAKIQAQQDKMYFKNLVIHPIKVIFTFVQTAYPRRQHKETLQSTVLNVLMSLVGVEKLRLHLRSFEVSDAMESIRTLSDMIASKSFEDVRAQLTQIAGSLTMLGSPIGFARRVGSGVKAFFYEPYQGAVHGSHDFVVGLGRGTSTLFTGVVSGAMDSAAAIVGTASKGISHLSGDAEFVRKRALKRQQMKVNRGGILEGMREGGESIISGISSGVSGLVSKPIEEASKGGLQGFFKGLGLGIIGAAVKPVIGLSDGLTSVAQGISNQVDSSVKASHVRPPRALEPSALDPSVLVIVPLSLEAAFAQEFVATRAKHGHYDDSFLRYVPMETKGEAIILSIVYVYWRRRSALWGRVWANISHCVYMGDAVGIMLYSGGKNGGGSLVQIPCGSAQTAKRVYAALAQNTARMGNPSNVIPIDIVMKAGTLSPSGSRSQDLHLHTLIRDGRRTTQSTAEALRHVVDESLLGALGGYRFGSANGAVLNQITGSEDDVLKRAAHHLEKPIVNWQRVDQHVWRLLWEWGCIHSNLSACRCSVMVLINRSDSPIQITRVQLVIGRNVIIMGSNDTGYESESRSLLPEGMIVVFICAFPESPLDTGHLKANVNTAAFHAVVASTQRESFCEAKGGFTVGFLEKTVSDWWSKYVIVIS